MTYHKDRETNSAIIRLLDCLCTWERSTDRESTLILIPHSSDEPVVVAVDGKPIPIQHITQAVEIAINKRNET